MKLHKSKIISLWYASQIYNSNYTQNHTKKLKQTNLLLLLHKYQGSESITEITRTQHYIYRFIKQPLLFLQKKCFLPTFKYDTMFCNIRFIKHLKINTAYPNTSFPCCNILVNGFYLHTWKMSGGVRNWIWMKIFQWTMWWNADEWVPIKK